MNILTGKVGRILFALPFGIFGLFHFMNAGSMAGMVPIPGGVFWVYLTGVALLAACISILIEKKAKLACILLGIMLIIFVLSMHLPGVMNAATEQAMQSSMTMMLKDLALAGGAWILAGTFNGSDADAGSGSDTDTGFGGSDTNTGSEESNF